MSENHPLADQTPWCDSETEFWAGVAGGVAIAISAFPFLLFAFAVVTSWNRLTFSTLPYVLPTFAVAALAAWMAHFLALILTSICGLTCEKLFRLWKVNSRQLWVGALAGGTVALTLIFPFILPLMSFRNSDTYQSVFWALGFALPATALAQAGAIFGARRHIEVDTTSGNYWTRSLPSFSIAMLVYLTLAISVVLGLLKLMMLDNLIAFFMAWLAAQSVTMVGLLMLERLYAQLFEKEARLEEAGFNQDTDQKTCSG